MRSFETFTFLLGLFYFCAITQTFQFEECGLDLECIQGSLHNFIVESAAGDPQHGLKPMDPVSTYIFDVWPFKDKVKLCFENLTISGLKSAKLSDFKLDELIEDDKKAELTLLIEVEAKSHLKVEVAKHSQIPAGSYSIKATVLATAFFKYEEKINKGTKYYELGPEFINCHAVTIPDAVLADNLRRELKEVSIVTKQWEEYNKKKLSIRQSILCKMVESIFSVLIYNMRITSKQTPDYSVFKNFL